MLLEQTRPHSTTAWSPQASSCAPTAGAETSPGVVLGAPASQKERRMATTEDRTRTMDSDDAAIAELEEIVERQRRAFLADPFPSLEERQGLLGALAGMLISHRTEIQEAMSSDFGVHPTLAADLIEVLGPAGRAVYAVEQLATWMAPEPRAADPALFGSGRAYVQPQP